MARTNHNSECLSVAFDPDGRMVHLRELKRLVNDLTSCLAHIAQEELHIKEKPNFSISGLELGSVRLEVADTQSEPNSTRTLRRMNDVVRVLHGDLETSPVALETLEHVRKLALPVTRRVTNRMWLNGLPITTQFIANIDKRLNRDVVRAYGQIKGTLCEVHVRNTNEFSILPPISNKMIRCTFDEGLLCVVGGSLKRNVTVYGVMAYRGNDALPYHIYAERIDTHPHDSELPTLGDLKGIAPDLTGDTPTLEFLGEIRGV